MRTANADKLQTQIEELLNGYAISDCINAVASILAQCIAQSSGEKQTALDACETIGESMASEIAKNWDVIEQERAKNIADMPVPPTGGMLQ